MHKIKSGKQKFFSMHFQAGKDQTFFHTFTNSVQRSCKDTYRALPSPLRNSENITFPNSFVSARKGSFNKLSPVVSAFLPPFQWNTSGNIWFPHNSCSHVWNRNSMFRGDTVSRCFKITFVNLKYIYICNMWEDRQWCFLQQLQPRFTLLNHGTQKENIVQMKKSRIVLTCSNYNILQRLVDLATCTLYREQYLEKT